MILEEITLGKSKDNKRKAIQDNLGQQVILNDLHNNWCHGVLSKDRRKTQVLSKDSEIKGVRLKDGYDDRVYQMKVVDGRGEMQLHYGDLKQLLIIVYHQKYRKPKIG